MKFFLVLCVLPCVVFGATLYDAKENLIEEGRSEKSEMSVGGNAWKLLNKVMADCNNDDFSKMSSCLGVKAVTAIDRASRMNSITLVSGINLINEDNERNSRSLVTEEQVTNEIESAPSGDKSGRLLEMIFDNAAKFLQTHTVSSNCLWLPRICRALWMKVPNPIPNQMCKDLQDLLNGNFCGSKKDHASMNLVSRGKLAKKKFTPILMLLGAKIFAILPIVIGVVGFMAIKALLIGKLAMLLAGFLAVQKFVGGGGFSGAGLSKFSPDSYVSSPAVSHGSGWSAPATGAQSGGYYRRSYQDAQNLAYAAQAPEEVSS
ncbi:hypothetical protein WDU94_002083 [Cyamophila willieti]